MKKANINNIIKKAKKYLPHINEERVLRAYEFAKKAHAGVFRSSGEPYIQHPVETTDILMELKPDEDSIIAGLLHDVLEDTDITAEEIEKEFGKSLMPLLKGLEKLGKIKYKGEERQVENLRKMFLAMAKDIRVILVKLSDRLHNMRTLKHLKPEKQKRIAEETLSIYSPIAARLGIFEIKNELDDLCFQSLYPKEYKEIQADLKSATGTKKNLIKRECEMLREILKKSNIEAEVEGRIKHSYSIYRKLKRKNKNFVSELYDIFALRIIVKNEAQCYQSLGAIHKEWTPLTRRFKDYIANKKENDYQSLHTTVIGMVPELSHQPVEIQIRTHKMNEIAKYGIAAHWQYKEEGGYSIAVPEHKLNWVQSLVALHENLQSNSEFTEALSVDIFHDRIFCVTPNGDIKDLPRNATPIDFAYAVHTDVGQKCKGAKVDGKIAPLNYKLKNNEVVEILTGTINSPNRYWLSFVVTSLAKTSIKHWFNAQEKGNLIKLGKELINKHLKRLRLSGLSSNLGLLKTYGGFKKLTIKEREEILEKVGNGSIEAISVIRKIVPQKAFAAKEVDKGTKNQLLADNINLSKIKDILITGEKGYKTRIATCCEPTVENEIVGYTTRGRGVTIHRVGCKVLKGHDEKRLIEASWGTKTEPTFKVKLEIEKRSRIGLLRDIAEVFTQNDLSILDMTIGSVLTMDTIVGSMDSLDTLIHQLKSIPDIYDVKEMDDK